MKLGAPAIDTHSREDATTIDQRMRELRSRISDLGHEVDSQRTAVAAAMGGGVFAILLALIAVYDILNGKSGVWLMVGITRAALNWIAAGLGAAGCALVGFGILRRVRPGDERVMRLAQMEQQYADLLERKSAIERAGGE